MADAAGPKPGLWGAQGNGTFLNPILPGDFSDLDAIRVGTSYYAISSTMQYSPGMAILHSQDLVNWSIIGHVVSNLTVLDPGLNWNKMDRAGRGIWAGAIRYHAGRFWVYFGTPDQGIYVSKASRAAGPWSLPKLILRESGWDDPCPFWDDDGQGYLVATHFAKDETGKSYNIHLFKMNLAGDGLLGGFDRSIHQSPGSEANKFYKIHGVYYHYFSEVRAEGRVPMMERSPTLEGPWEMQQLMHVHPLIDKEPNQGGLVQTPAGRWYFMTHQGTGDWEGRAGVLLPVTWIRGWPIPGKRGADGIGNMEWSVEKPIPGYPLTNLNASDEFNDPSLQPGWEWRYQPRPGGWSLRSHPGYLRLYGTPALRSGDFDAIPDVLTQRSFRTRQNQVTVRIDVAGMQDGQEAGIAHFAKTYATLSVLQRKGVRQLSYNRDGSRIAGPVLRSHNLYLRTTWNEKGKTDFSYSIDGKSFETIGTPYPLTWSSYRGDRVGLFSVTNGTGDGYVDFDWFHYRVQR